MKQMTRIKVSTLMIHLGGWLIFFTLPAWLVAGLPGQEHSIDLLLAPHVWIFYLIYIVAFYWHSYVLFPRLYLEKKYALYFSAVLLLFVLTYIERPFEEIILRTHSAFHPLGMRALRDHGAGMSYLQPGPDKLPDPPPGAVIVRRQGDPFWHRLLPLDVVNLILFGLLLATGAAIHLSREWAKSKQKAAQAEVNRIGAELSLLKLQMNPHFLFNTLNTIYSLIATGRDDAGEAVLKLSGLLRYLTDEIDQDLIPLEKELAHIRDYLDLMRLRLDQRVTIDFLTTGNPMDKSVPPLLLITFIENAFKHGVSNHEDSPIAIRIFADEDRLTFLCQNKLFANNRLPSRAGVGIANARRRLEHLYPDNYDLAINTNDGLYRVYLLLKIQPG